MGDNRRILVATIASMVILFAWQKFMMPPPAPKPAPTKTVEGGAPAPAPSPTAAGTAEAPPSPAAAAVAADEPEKRIVLDTSHFTAFCPYASRFPFETWIVPKAHSSHFENIPKPCVDDLGTFSLR